MLQPLKPRYYSISSSPKASPGSLSISVSVVKGISPSGREHVGVASNCLKNSVSNCQGQDATEELIGPFQHSNLGVFVKDTGSSFRLPDDPSIPVIMIGPGTGVAPMRGFIQERVSTGAKDNVLFFGCRDDNDYIYKKELEKYQESGYLKLLVAFSRKSGKPKVYVQHLIEQNAALLVDLFKRGAHVYVCGDASKMAPDVKQVLTRILDEAGLDTVSVLQTRYFEDVWAAQSI
jgi:cytochrome P450/NADPH-cytochrome P450 reductase